MLRGKFKDKMQGSGRNPFSDGIHWEATRLPTEPNTRNMHQHYSCRIVSTGFVDTAFPVKKPVVTRAIIKAKSPAAA